MKKKILLIDESLTIQKVVALTLDRARYHVAYAKSRAEAVKLVMEAFPELILVSDQIPDVQLATFPREVENWALRGNYPAPAVVLITSQDPEQVPVARHYAGVLKKPFSPQTLLALVTAHSPNLDEPFTEPNFEDQRLQKAFNEAFNDE